MEEALVVGDMAVRVKQIWMLGGLVLVGAEKKREDEILENH